MRWEYKTINFKKRSFFSGALNIEELNQQLDVLGRDGWELVSMCQGIFGSSSQGVIAVFKRSR